uniref:Rho-GAP domain-containing protein n=1 Tax=Brugia timori TaxID=42155 RepID=A0A0R3QNK5_9BILA
LTENALHERPPKPTEIISEISTNNLCISAVASNRNADSPNNPKQQKTFLAFVVDHIQLFLR